MEERRKRVSFSERIRRISHQGAILLSAGSVKDIRRNLELKSTKIVRLQPAVPKPWDYVAILGFALTVTFFIPLIASLEIQNDDTVHSFSTSLMGRMMFAVSLSVSLPLIIDVALDYLSLSVTPDYSHLYLRSVSLLAMCTFNIVFITSSGSNLLLEQVVSTCQIFVEFAMLIWLLNNLDSRGCWSTPRCIALLLFVYGYLILQLATQINPSGSLPLISFISLLLFSVLYLYSTFRWAYTLFDQVGRKKGKPLSANDQYSILVIISTFLFGLSFYVLSIIFSSDSDYEYLLMGYYVIRTVLTFSICLLPGRMYRQKAIQFEYDAEVKTSFVRYMSHELRTPMSVLSLGLELLSSQIESGESKERLQNTIKELEACCKESTSILDDLLLYEKLHRNKYPAEFEDKHVVSFLCATMEPSLRSIRDAQVVFKMLDSPKTSLEALHQKDICVDKKLFASQLMKVLGHILASAQPGDEVHLDAYPIVVTSTDESKAKIAPISTSPMHSNFLRIAFSTSQLLIGDLKTHFEGDGFSFDREVGGASELSIYILKRVAELHGGRAGMSTDGSNQACIYIDIPWSRVEKAEASATSSRYQNFAMDHLVRLHSELKPLNGPDDFKSEVSGFVSLSPDSPGVGLKEVPSSLSLLGEPMDSLHLLVVDDSAMNRKIMIQTMKALGHTCGEANDGSVALDMMAMALTRGELYDAVLLDNEMPIMRGRDAVRKMRELGYTGLVLGVTGNALVEDVADFKANGANEVVIKPLTVAKFKEAVMNHNKSLLQIDETSSDKF